MPFGSAMSWDHEQIVEDVNISEESATMPKDLHTVISEDWVKCVEINK
jgi:hypothetical protein